MYSRSGPYAPPPPHSAGQSPPSRPARNSDAHHARYRGMVPASGLRVPARRGRPGWWAAMCARTRCRNSSSSGLNVRPATGLLAASRGRHLRVAGRLGYALDVLSKVGRAALWAVADLLRCPLGDEGAEVEDVQIVGHAEDHLDVVLDHQQ